MAEEDTGATEAKTASIARAMGKGIAPELFEHEMVSTSKVLGRESGLKVIIGGDKASAEGKVVVLPAIGKDKNVDHEAAGVARGFVNHEAGHARWTNPYTVNRVKRSEKHLSVFNGMEDARIEAKFASEYPGSQRHFESAANATMGMFLDDVRKGDIKIDDKSKLLPMAIAWAGRRQAGFNVNPAMMADFEKLIGSKGMAAAEKLAASALKANSSIDIARHLENWLGKLSPETEREKEHGGGTGEDPAGAERNTSMGEAPTPGEMDASEIKPNEKDFTDMTKAVNKVLGAGASRAEYRSDLEQDKIWPVVEFMNGPACARQRSGEYNNDDYVKELEISFPHAVFNKGQVPSDPDDQRMMGLATVASMRENLGPAVRAVKQALERGLVTARQRQWDGGMQRGHIDPKRLVNVRTGSKNFRRVKSPEDMVDTAVTLLIDMSGSMCNEKSIEAMKAAFVFADSLDKVGVPIEILGFTSDRQAAKDPYDILARTGIIDMPVYKSFNESMKQHMWKVGLITQCTFCSRGGQNADGDSLIHAWRRLRLRPEPRKVLIVFSDGQPASNNRLGNSAERQHLKRVVAKIIGDGVDVLGVGILSEAVKSYYPQRVVIKSAEDLPRVAGKMLRELLIPKGVKQRQSRATARAA
jgi:cobalamin biosynthesis protein CobT